MFDKLIEELLPYLIIILPSLTTIIGGLVSSLFQSNRVKKATNESLLVSKEALTAVNSLKDSNEFRELRKLIKDGEKDRRELTKALTLATEELTRIHKAHPEWIEEDK